MFYINICFTFIHKERSIANRENHHHFILSFSPSYEKGDTK